jgi:hypothetical protein
MEYEASRKMAKPADQVFAIASKVENLLWIRGLGGPELLYGDGTSPGSKFRLVNIVGRESVFEVLACGEAEFSFCSVGPSDLVSAALSVTNTGDGACNVTWRQNIRPQNTIERLIVTLGGPFSRRASIREAQGELEKLEKVIEWVEAGRKGDPFPFYTFSIAD